MHWLSKKVVHFSKHWRPARSKFTYEVLSFDDEAACGSKHRVTTNTRSEVTCKRCEEIVRKDIYNSGG